MSEYSTICPGTSVASGRMGKKRGFFAELQHQQRLAEQRRRNEHVAQVAAHHLAALQAERAQRDYEYAVAAAQRAAAAEKAAADREARYKYLDSRRAQAERKAAAALEAFEQIDNILAATLDVDDYVDVETLKMKVEHPSFPREDLKKPTPEPRLEQAPPEPQYVAPPQPTGLSKMLNKKKYEQEAAQAHAVWAQLHQKWHDYVHRQMPAKNAALLDAHAKAEQKRASELSAAIAEYKGACAEREREVAEANLKLDEFKRLLAAGDSVAINDYVGIVLANSVYPAAFEVDYEYLFDAEVGELTIKVIVPPPTAVPAFKACKYLPNTDEIKQTACTQKEQRERYNNAVAAVAVRTFHEVFESDRDRRIQTVSLTVETETINPATGLPDRFPFVAAAADRDEFSEYDLRNVDPISTLTHMRASVSKNAWALKPISTARGVR